MLDKCGEGTRYIYQKQCESAKVPKAVSIAYARRDDVMNVNLFLATRLDLSCYRPLCGLHKPVTDWLETLPHSSDGLNM